MKGLFLVFGVGFLLVSGLAYGDYPPAEKIFAHLIDEKGDVSTRFKRLFYEVRSEAKERLNSGQPDPRKMVGEERGLIALPKHAEPSDIAMPKSTFSDGHKTVLTDTETSEVMLSDTSLSDITFSEKREGEKKQKDAKRSVGKKERRKNGTLCILPVIRDAGCGGISLTAIF